MKNIKKIILLTLIIILSIPSILFAMEEDSFLPPWLDEYDIRINQNGQYLDSNVKGIEIEDKVLAPLRMILEYNNYKVTWKNNRNVYIIKEGFDDLQISIDSSDYKLSNQEGNILIDLEFFNQFPDFEVNYDKVNKTIFISSINRKKDDIFLYDLGDRKMKTSLNRDLVYNLNGSLALPETYNNPLVFIIHGAHAINKADINRYDLGYSYLARELSKQGFIVVNLNASIHYSYEDGEPIGSERLHHIFEETIESLIAANDGTNLDFGVDLNNKIDFTNTFLIGHSRSGQEIFNLSNIYKDDSRIKFKGLLSLAPARIYEMDYNLTDIPSGIVLPELDGDVFGLDGQWIFDEIIDSKNRKSELQSVFLYGANHNAFNEALLKQDQGKDWYTGEINSISPEKQRNFLVDYASNFFNFILEEKSLLNLSDSRKEDLLGYKALVSTFSPGNRIYQADQGLEGVGYDGLLARPVISSYIPNENTAGLFYPPGTREYLPLLNIKWDKINSKVNFKTDDSSKDAEFISLYLAQDSTDKINNEDNQSFSLTLIDKNNKKSTIILDKTTASLKHHDGEGIFDDTAFSSHTPLSILNINLNEFSDIDIDNIKEIEFEFTENKKGSIMLRHIQFI